MRLTVTCHACEAIQISTDPGELFYYRAPDSEHRSGWYIDCRSCRASEPVPAAIVPTTRRKQISADRAEAGEASGIYRRRAQGAGRH
jgi:hypothetical protein